MPKRSVRPWAAASSRIQAQLLRHLGRRLAPGQVDVGVPRRRPARPPPTSRRSRRRAAGPAGAARSPPRPGSAAPSKSNGSAAPRAADDGQELRGPGVPLVVRQVVAEPALLVGLAAGDHVEQQPAAGQPLVGGRHLGGQRRRGQPGPERDQELQPPGLPGQRGGDQPGVLAPGAGRGEHRLEAELLGGAGHLGQVLDVRRPLLRRGAPDVRGVRPPPGGPRRGLAGGRLCPRPMIERPSPVVGRNQWKVRLIRTSLRRCC